VLLDDEKGKLLNDLVEKKDYVIVNELIWKIIKKLYGTNAEIK